MAADAIIPGGIDHTCAQSYTQRSYTLSLGSLFGISRQNSVRVLSPCLLINSKYHFLNLVTFF